MGDRDRCPQIGIDEHGSLLSPVLLIRRHVRLSN